MPHLISYDFRFCPYCGHGVDFQAVIPGTQANAGKSAQPPRDHVQCLRCGRCLTCEEKATHGWKRSQHGDRPRA